MNKKLAVKDFELRNFKLSSKGHPTVDWFDLTQTNELFSVESDSEPHEDLVNKLAELKTVFAESLGLLAGWNFARENNRKNEEKLQEAVRCYNEEVLRCNVTGVKITDKGIKIIGSLICDEGNVSITSPLVKFENDNIELGLQAQSIVDDLQIEVWKFIYGGKRGNDLFSSEEKPEDKSGLGTNTDKQMSVA